MLKRIVIIVFSFFLNLNSVNSNDLKIAYVDVDGVINQSNAGKKINKQIHILSVSTIPHQISFNTENPQYYTVTPQVPPPCIIQHSTYPTH